MDSGAVTQSGPCCSLPLTLIMSSGPLWSGKNPREEPGDDLARGRNVAKWMSIHFSLIHNPYSLNDPSLLPFLRKVATGPCPFFPLSLKQQCPSGFCRLLAFSLLHLYVFPSVLCVHVCSSVFNCPSPSALCSEGSLGLYLLLSPVLQQKV